MNDTAVEALGMLTAFSDAAPAAGLAPGLAEIAARGIVRRGDVLVWADSVGRVDEAPSILPDLTAWECADSSFHLEDFVPVPIGSHDDEPVIAEADQRTLLRHGFALALRFASLVRAIDPPAAVRCITGVNGTGGTFRFHQLRPGESWHDPNLDAYRLDKTIVVDISPSTPEPAPGWARP